METSEIAMCGKCGKPHVTKTGKPSRGAHSKQSGVACKRPPHPGAAVCTTHGLNGRARANAANRLHRAAIDGQVGQMLAQYKELIPDGMDPLTGLLAVVSRTWLMMRVYGDLWPVCVATRPLSSSSWHRPAQASGTPTSSSPNRRLSTLATWVT